MGKVEMDPGWRDFFGRISLDRTDLNRIRLVF